MQPTSSDSPAVLDLLRQFFGYDAFRPGQQDVVDRLMSGRPVLAIFPTGGGKSLCYQLPALAIDGLTLVISPLIALMRDQVDALQARGIPAARLDSTLAADEEQSLLARLDAGEIKLLYVAPERFANERFRENLKRWSPQLAAIDEAHCIAEWGHNFRPDYLKLARALRRMKIPRVLALTATATPAVAREIRRFFRIASDDEVRLPFDRPNLELRVTACTPDQRKAILLDRVRAIDGAVVVYVTRQETAEEVATFLLRHGESARAYHAGLRADFRARAQQAFMDGETRVIVATIAFGMGIDKGDIRGVIHYNLPKSPENLVQETGRAGRDGMPARCEILACAQDLTVLENFIHADVPGRRALGALLDRVLRLGPSFELSLYNLSRACDIRQTVVETVLAHLETDGLLTHGGRRHSAWRVRLLRSEDQLLAGRSAGEARRLKKLLASAVSERGWWMMDDQSCGDKNAAGLLADLALAGDAIVEPRRVMHRYRLKSCETDVRAIIDSIIARFERRERDDLARLAKVVEYATQPGCLTAWLAEYFGTADPVPCGNCDRCHGRPPVVITRPPARNVTDEEWRQITELVQSRDSALGSARQLARFLCGMTSPATRFTRDPRFGLLGDLPFHEVFPITRAVMGG
ncbi:MAG: ATP-dependent DNA helicase RecQ [Luteolibacter sp.]